jgi:hypothetical protein
MKTIRRTPLRILLMTMAMLAAVAPAASAQEKKAPPKKVEKKETLKTPRVSFHGVGTKKILNAINTTARKAKGTVVKTEKKPVTKATPTPKPAPRP